MCTHDFHVAKIDIEYNYNTGSIEIISHIFIDDLEDALEKQGIDSLYLCTRREAQSADHFIGEYLNEHLKIDIDGTNYKLAYLGKEVSDDLSAVWCYLEVENVEPTHDIVVQCSILMELFDDQTNMVKIQQSKTNREFFLFREGESEGKLMVK